MLARWASTLRVPTGDRLVNVTPIAGARGHGPAGAGFLREPQRLHSAGLTRCCCRSSVPLGACVPRYRPGRDQHRYFSRRTPETRWRSLEIPMAQTRLTDSCINTIYFLVPDSIGYLNGSEITLPAAKTNRSRRRKMNKIVTPPRIPSKHVRLLITRNPISISALLVKLVRQTMSAGRGIYVSDSEGSEQLKGWRLQHLLRLGRRAGQGSNGADGKAALLSFLYGQDS